MSKVNTINLNNQEFALVPIHEYNATNKKKKDNPLSQLKIMVDGVLI